MELYKELQKKNSIDIHLATDECFSPYGEILSIDTEEIQKALEQTPIPAEKNIYIASDEKLESLEEIKKISHAVFGGIEAQAGYCNGRNVALGAEEWHDCSEINITGTPLILLLALYSDLEDGILDSKKVKAFYLPKNTVIRLYPMVLHFAPCAVTDDGFRCIVGLTKGTNAPMTTEEAMRYSPLKAVNKWMIAHPERQDLIDAGAKQGITGENIVIVH